jgi:hypothetical protein
MTSFLRTRKDRHPKPESKLHSPYDHTQSGNHQRSDREQKQVHHAYQETYDVPPRSERHNHTELDDMSKSDNNKRTRGTVRKNHNGTLTLSLDNN